MIPGYHTQNTTINLKMDNIQMASKVLTSSSKLYSFVEEEEEITHNGYK